MPNKPPPRHANTIKRKPWSHQKNARERGYTWDWEQFSRLYRQQQPICELCESEGMVAAAASVHHIAKIEDAPERKLDRSNVISLCEACHRKADRDGMVNQRCKALAEAMESATPRR